MLILKFLPSFIIILYKPVKSPLKNVKIQEFPQKCFLHFHQRTNSLSKITIPPRYRYLKIQKFKYCTAHHLIKNLALLYYGFSASHKFSYFRNPHTSKTQLLCCCHPSHVFALWSFSIFPSLANFSPNLSLKFGIVF